MGRLEKPCPVFLEYTVRGDYGRKSCRTHETRACRMGPMEVINGAMGCSKRAVAEARAVAAFVL